MKTKLFMTMAAATMILAGCSNDENEPVDNWNGEIRLSSGVTTQTRANTQATQIQSDETVYAWADKASATPNYIKAWTLTAGSGNDFTGTSQYYPTDGSKLDFYALHGNFKRNYIYGKYHCISCISYRTFGRSRPVKYRYEELCQVRPALCRSERRSP